MNPRTKPTGIWIPATIGLLAGFFSGLLGVGGGLVMVPLLTAVLLMPQHDAHVHSLAAIVPIAIVGAAGLALAGEIDMAIAAGLAAGALLGAPVGARIMDAISEEWLKIAFGVLLIVGALRMWWT